MIFESVPGFSVVRFSHPEHQSASVQNAAGVTIRVRPM